MTSWPPELKDFVARSMSAAIPSNKSALNDEIKALIFKHHAAGTISTTNWASLNPVDIFITLQKTANRQAWTPPPPPPASAGTKGNGHLPTQFGSTSGGAGAGVKRKHKEPSTPATTSKKQKASAAAAAFPSAYTFATTEEDAMKAKRAQRFQREHDIEAQRGMSPAAGSASGGSMAAFVPRAVAGKGLGGVGKAGRVLAGRMGLMEDEIDPNVINWDRDTIVGTNQKIEKSYLRLTSAPDPANIRPLAVLRTTLEHLKRRWRETKDYPYILDQFKSMRQDLTVQRIKNEFTVSVYEIFARMAMEKGDMGEYNQCQSILKQLYEHNIDGHADEFLCYRILYMIFTNQAGELLRTLTNIPQHMKAAPDVNFALNVQTAISTGNYHRFFKLYLDAPKMSGYLMDKFVTKERIKALAKMSHAYMTISLTFIQTELAFDDLQESDVFLHEQGLAFYQKPKTAAESEFPTLQAAATKSAKRGHRHLHPPAPPPVPLEERVWECKPSQARCKAIIDDPSFKKVDLKGQLDPEQTRG